MSKLRLGYARIAQETHAFSPLPTTLADFERFHWLEGDALQEATGILGNEVPGWTRAAELSGFRQAALRHWRHVEAVPLMSAWAVPSGPITGEAFSALRDRLLTSLREAGRIDGLYLSLHGAMRGGTGAPPEPEEAILEAVRAELGPDVPVAVSLDLHALLTRRKVEIPDILVAYRTNPHRDLARTGRRAGELLIRAVRGEVRPVSAWRALPMVLGGGTTVDLFPTMRPLFRRMSAMERDPRVLYASLFMCHLWNDSRDLGWATHVVTDGDAALAESLADELAERAWAVRDISPPAPLSATEAIAKAREAGWARRLGTICLVDASDVVGAGAPGENTNLLRTLLRDAADLTAYLPLRDALVLAQLWDRPEGDAVRVSLGGKLDPDTNPPLAVEGVVGARDDSDSHGRRRVLHIGQTAVVLTERAPYTLKPSYFGDLGLDPWRADLVVVKSFFHFRIYFLLVLRRSFLVKTGGLTDFDVYEWIDFRDPVHPRDPVADWRPADRRRRGLS